MSYWDNFKSRVSSNGTTEREQLINEFKSDISEDFGLSPNYYQVDLNGSNIDVQITDDSQVRDEKLLITYYETPISSGSVITWRSDNWLVIHFDEMSEIYKRCRIRKCIGTLKWLNEDGFEREVDFAYSSPSTTNFGIENGQIIDLGNERRQLVIQGNVDSKKIKKNKRFIFDDRAWKVTAIDKKSSSGLIFLTLIENEISAADNLDLEIADYVANVANYTVQIANGESFSIRANQTLQLSAIVKNNGKVVTKSVLWSVSNDSIASIDSNGFMTAHANGIVTVTVRLEMDTTVSDNATVNVEFATVNNYSIELDSSLEVLSGTSKTFTAIVKNNNVVDPARTVQWYLFADDGVSIATTASMTFSSTTQCTLKGVKVGNCKLKAVLIGSSPIISQEFRIKIESLI